MSSPDKIQGENLSMSREMEILSSIQDASVKTSLPMIIAIFKHLSGHTEFVDKMTIKREIIDDEDLKSAVSGSKITVDEVVLDNSINVLILQGIFLESVDDKIGLTARGKEAAELLGLIESR